MEMFWSTMYQTNKQTNKKTGQKTYSFNIFLNICTYIIMHKKIKKYQLMV